MSNLKYVSNRKAPLHYLWQLKTSDQTQGPALKPKTDQFMTTVALLTNLHSRCRSVTSTFNVFRILNGNQLSALETYLLGSAPDHEKLTHNTLYDHKEYQLYFLTVIIVKTVTYILLIETQFPVVSVTVLS